MPESDGTAPSLMRSRVPDRALLRDGNGHKTAGAGTTSCPGRVERSGTRHRSRACPRSALKARKSGKPDLRGPSARVAKRNIVFNKREAHRVTPGSRLSLADARSSGTREPSCRCPRPSAETREALHRQLLAQITPLRVRVLDERELPRPTPALQAMLTRARFENGRVLLEIDELVDAVPAGEAGNELAFVLTHPADEIVGDTDIERAIVPARKDVDEVRIGHLVIRRGGARLGEAKTIVSRATEARPLGRADGDPGPSAR